MDILQSLGHMIWYVAIPFIVLLGVLVFVHELGHFLVARACGVRVEVFSLGFGKKLFQYKRGDTNYCLSLVPLGGYVKMFGEQPGDTIAPELRDVSFTHKHVLKRMAIVLAGPLMNFFFAILLFALVSLSGEERRPAVLGDIKAESSASVAGFRSGDRILAVAGRPVETWDQLQNVLNSYMGQEVLFRVQSQEDSSPREIKAPVVAAENPNPLETQKEVGVVEGFESLSKGTHVAVLKDSLLQSLGVKTGDQITSVNDKPIQFWRDLMTQLQGSAGQGTIAIGFTRVDPKSRKSENFTVNVRNAGPNLKAFGLESTDLYLAEVMKGSPAAKAGLLKGDRLVEISSKNLQSWDDVLQTIKGYDGSSGPLKFVILREGALKTLEITPQMTTHMNHLGKEEHRYTIGISPMISLTSEKAVVVTAAGIGPALASGYQKSYNYTVMTLLSFVRLAQGEISPKNVGGVISIGSAASESFKAGLSYFLQMMGIISISLFVINLLPVPVLDGGHLLFYTVELVKGSPVSLKKMELAQQVGLVLLMSLMLFALYNDFSRILGLY